MNETKPELWPEQLSRVHGMAVGDPTWDLSENDCAALQAVLSKLEDCLRDKLEAKQEQAVGLASSKA